MMGVLVLKITLLCFLFEPIFVNGESELRFSNQYANGMVLQRSPIRSMLWGYGSQNSSVKVVAVGESYYTISTKDTSGDYIWRLLLDPIEAGGPYVITVSSKNESIQLTDVLFGDVWFCGGQSNMVFTTNMSFKGQEEIEMASNYPHIRLFTTARYSSLEPIDNLKPEYILQNWSAASNKSVGGGAWSYFSAVCWMFGRRLSDLYHIPIGLISSNYGGTPVEGWSSPEALDVCKIKQNLQKSRIAPQEPSVLWNAMINPFLQTSIFGVIWYQGEGNSMFPNNYNCTFPAMVHSWRKSWHNKTNNATNLMFPFGFVQLAPVIHEGDDFPRVRWDQTARYGYVPNVKLPSTFMAVAIDLPDDNSPYGNIHPRDKTDVADRLILGARAIAYKERIMFQGPVFMSATYRVISRYLINVEIIYKPETIPESGIEVFSVSGFEVQVAPSQEWTSAYISNVDGNRVTITAEGLSNHILGVRYAWSNKPCAFKKCGVYAGGLPSGPFIKYFTI